MIEVSAETDSLFHLKGSVEHFEASACKDALKKCLDACAGKNITIDISKLESVSSVSLSFLLYGLRSAKLISTSLVYSNMSPALFNMARVSGIEGILIQSSDKAN